MTFGLSTSFPRFLGALAVLCLCAACADSEAPPRLERIQDRGFLTCGVWTGIAGFAAVDENGRYSGMDVDICRAVSAAIFGTPDHVQYVRAENVRQMSEEDDLDIVSRRITWSLTRAAANDLMFGPVFFYDGQGFLVPRRHGIGNVEDLENRAVCVQTAEAHAATLASYSLERGLNLTSVPVRDNEDVKEALESDRCAAYSADVSLLGAARLEVGPDPDAFVILPDMISKEPLSPLVRMGDDRFFEIVRWTIFATIAAEEFGITSDNVDAARKRRAPEVQRLLGVIPGNGAALGLDESWAYDVIKTMGNYGEIFDRNVGRNSPIKLDRGLNRLWTDGGLMYAPRLR